MEGDHGSALLGLRQDVIRHVDRRLELGQIPFERQLRAVLRPLADDIGDPAVLADDDLELSPGR